MLPLTVMSPTTCSFDTGVAVPTPTLPAFVLLMLLPLVAHWACAPTALMTVMSEASAASAKPRARDFFNVLSIVIFLPSAVGTSEPAPHVRTRALRRWLRRSGGRHRPSPAPEEASSRPSSAINRGSLGSAISCRQGRRGSESPPPRSSLVYVLPFSY